MIPLRVEAGRFLTEVSMHHTRYSLSRRLQASGRLHTRLAVAMFDTGERLSELDTTGTTPFSLAIVASHQ